MSDEKVGQGDRFNVNKLGLDMVPPSLNEAVAQVLEFGMAEVDCEGNPRKSYARLNWRLGMSYSTVLGCLKRHLAKYEDPLKADHDYGKGGSGLPELYHIACNIMMLIEYEHLGYGHDLDDRWKKPKGKKNE